MGNGSVSVTAARSTDRPCRKLSWVSITVMTPCPATQGEQELESGAVSEQRPALKNGPWLWAGGGITCGMRAGELRILDCEQPSLSFLWHEQTLPVISTLQKKGRSSINVLLFREQPGEHRPPPEPANSCRRCLGSPEMGGSRDGGCVLIPAVGTSSGLWDHTCLGSDERQQQEG